MKYTFGTDLFHETDLQRLLVRETGKWVVHLIAEGLRDNPDKASEFLEFYADKVDNIEILNALYTAPKRKEAYVLIERDDDARAAYEFWFPHRGELADDEQYLFVEVIVMGPNNQFFSNASVPVTTEE